MAPFTIDKVIKVWYSIDMGVYEAALSAMYIVGAMLGIMFGFVLGRVIAHPTRRR